ncbi:MAG: S1C family serine protease [Planctomycetota bacterium]
MKTFSCAVAMIALVLTSSADAFGQSVDFRAAIRGAEPVMSTATFTLAQADEADPRGRLGRRFPSGPSEVVSNAFAVSDDLVIAYVGRPADSVVLESPRGEVTDGTIVCMDYVTGLAAIKVQEELMGGLVIGSANVEAGLPIVSLSMRDGALTANSGMVSTKPLPVSAMGLIPQVEFVGQAPSKGAPLLDSDGIVVGVMVPSERELVCVPAPAVQRLVETAIGEKPQNLKRGLVGLQFEERGPLVTQVSEESAASTAGLKAGDLVVRVDQTEIASSADVIAAVAAARAGDSIEVSVKRGDATVAIPVTLSEHPQQILAAAPALSRQWQRGFELKDGRLVPMEIPQGMRIPEIPNRLFQVPMDGLRIERSNVEDILQQLQQQMRDVNKRLDPGN